LPNAGGATTAQSTHVPGRGELSNHARLYCAEAFSQTSMLSDRFLLNACPVNWLPTILSSGDAPSAPPPTGYGSNGEDTMLRPFLMRGVIWPTVSSATRSPPASSV